MTVPGTRQKSSAVQQFRLVTELLTPSWRGSRHAYSCRSRPEEFTSGRSQNRA